MLLLVGATFRRTPRTGAPVMETGASSGRHKTKEQRETNQIGEDALRVAVAVLNATVVAGRLLEGHIK